MDRTAAAKKAADFLARHTSGTPLIVPNPWDEGSARLLTSLGFEGLATTSSGQAATRGLTDGSLSREETLAMAGAIAGATHLPVTADLEHGFGATVDAVSDTVAGARSAGLSGCSIEDSTGRADRPIFELGEATDRIRAAADAAHRDEVRLVLTARSENYLHGRPDLADTIRRLQAFEDAGADVLYAPGLADPTDIATVVASVGCPVNVLARPGGPDVAALATLGVRRISVGGSLCFAAFGAVAGAARELLSSGTFTFFDQAVAGREALAGVLVDADADGEPQPD